MISHVGLAKKITRESQKDKRFRSVEKAKKKVKKYARRENP